MRMAKDKEEKCSLHITATVVKNIRLCNEHYCLTLKNDILANTTKPGQFVNLRIDGRDDLLLRRPFSVAMTRPPQSLLEIVYRVVGQGTRSMTELSRGEKVDLIGPLGTGFHLPEEPTNCLLVGGGVGVAPLWGLAAQLSKQKNRIVALLGFRSSDNVFGEDIFRKLRVETIVTTDDGSYGLKGFVSDHLEKGSKSLGWLCVCLRSESHAKSRSPHDPEGRNQRGGLLGRENGLWLWRLSLLCGQYR